MRISFTFLIVLIFSINTFAQQNYSKVRIDVSQKGIQGIAGAGIDLSSGWLKKDSWFEADLSGREIEKVKEAGYRVEILINDVSSFYSQRAMNSTGKLNRNVNEEWPVPAHWEQGSMGGFYTLDEVLAELDEMHSLYPNLISEKTPVSSTNLTHDGRMQYWVRLSDNPDTNEDEPEILYSGVHHAREPMSVQQMIWYMWYLLENYDSIPDVQTLVDNTEMYFVPVVNPDGYEYNHQTDPNGGGMWRKNRRDNGDGTHGVDPNRNYGYKWGYDNSGSSPNPGDQTYRGPAPFSEPCIQNMRDFSNDHDFKIALNYHSYSNLLLYSWGYITDPTPDDELFHEYAVLMTKENGYTYGPASTTIYPTNGDANDWMYGEQETKNKIFAYTPEVGNSNDGFWPSPLRIVPLCQEQMWQNITAARLVGKYAKAADASPMILSEDAGYLKYSIKRLGLTECDTFKVSIQPLDSSLLTVGGTKNHVNMALLQTDNDSISYQLAPGTEEGISFSYLLKVDNGDFVVSDTITKVYGTEVVVFEDDGENMDNWTSNKWDITSADYHSPVASITDSPNGNYHAYESNPITLDTVIKLTNTPMAFLKFWAKWDIEAGYDYVQVFAKNVNGGNWIPLSGKYTKTGNSNQAYGEPLYDGTMNDWVQEEISLNDFVGDTISLRFQLNSDTYVEGDGFYFDDLTVSVISSTTGIVHHPVTNTIYVSKAYPNPATEQVNIAYNLNGISQTATYQLFSVNGSQMATGTLTGNSGTLRLKVNNLIPGIYFLKIGAKGRTVVRKVMVR